MRQICPKLPCGDGAALGFELMLQPVLLTSPHGASCQLGLSGSPSERAWTPEARANSQNRAVEVTSSIPWDKCARVTHHGDAIPKADASIHRNKY